MTDQMNEAHREQGRIAEIRARFQTVAPDQEQAYFLTYNREQFADLAQMLAEQTAPCREQALALTHLEQAKFWANQAIVHNGLHPNVVEQLEALRNQPEPEEPEETPDSEFTGEPLFDDDLIGTGPTA
jgi:ATP phosphoribosyltransferase